MARRINTQTGLPEDEAQIRSKHLCAFESESDWHTYGYSARIVETPNPATANQVGTEGAIDTSGNVPFTTWTVRDKTSGELVAEQAAALAATVDAFTNGVQAHLDACAKSKGYDNIVSACSYAGAANPFQTEGVAYVVWRGAVWAQCYADLAAIQAGTKAMPASLEAYLAELDTAHPAP